MITKDLLTPILVITRPIVEAAIVKCSQLTAAVIIEGFAAKIKNDKKVLILKSADNKKCH